MTNGVFISLATYNIEGICDLESIVDNIMTQTNFYVWKKKKQIAFVMRWVPGSWLFFNDFDRNVRFPIHSHPFYKHTHTRCLTFSPQWVSFLSLYPSLLLLHSRFGPLHHFHSIHKYHAHQINRIAKMLFILSLRFFCRYYYYFGVLSFSILVPFGSGATNIHSVTPVQCFYSMWIHLFWLTLFTSLCTILKYYFKYDE